MSQKLKKAMISSTARDLPEHRRMVMDACLRLGFRPIMMDHLAGQDRSATDVSVGMVEEADVYLGIFAHAYGSNPDNDPRSYTEIELEKAISLGITVIPFFVNEDVPWPPRLVDKGEKAERLEQLKQKAAKGRIRAEFKSPEDLRGLVIHALGEFERARAKPDEPTKASDLHPPNLIPKPPEAYIAHPYSLLQTKDVVGRQDELNLFTDWVTTNKQVPADTRIFNLVAIGGMGKSALTWKWFNDIAPNELPKLAGGMWWSFYESDAHWENFIIRALAYVSGQSEKAVREMKAPDREDQLWRILDQQPFLLVLDGLERILLAYARMDAAQMLDDDLDEQTANRVAKAHGLPESARESFIGKHQLRCAADHRAGRFLSRLARVRQSRVLITTRLYPAELQTDTGETMPGCFASFLTGLEDDDALDLWRELKVRGSREPLLLIFNSIQNYPFLIRALAGEVAAFRQSPGDFDMWKEAHPQFSTAMLSLRNATTHVLEYALRGLGDTQRKVLHTLAAFRMPATWETLRAVLVDPGEAMSQRSYDFPPEERSPKETSSPTDEENKACCDDRELDTMLTELEDRGLVGWDKKANRYDMNPVLRNFVWYALSHAGRINIYQFLYSYFNALPPTDEDAIDKVEDLTGAIELFSTLIGLKRFDEAYDVFSMRLRRALWYRLGVCQVQVELLNTLFPERLGQPPSLASKAAQLATLDALASSYELLGQLQVADTLYRLAISITNFDANDGDLRYVQLNMLCHVSGMSLLRGALRYAEWALKEALKGGFASKDKFWQFLSMRALGRVFINQGFHKEAKLVLYRALMICDVLRRSPVPHYPQVTIAPYSHYRHMIICYLSESALLANDPQDAGLLAEQSWELANEPGGCYERDLIHAALLQGAAALQLNDLDYAEERLMHSLNRSHSIRFVEGELPALTALAKCHCQKDEFGSARELLDQVWAPAEHGPFPLFHADALNVLAQIERDQGNRDAAIAAATKAYTLAWCDGPPYAYHYGLTNASKHLQELGAPEPQLPPFDASKFEPLPDVELNPQDEFWVDPDRLDS